jgi:hypothetical protein
MTAEPPTESTLSSEDRVFLRSLADMLRTQSDFFLARRREDPALQVYAGTVMVWRHSRFCSVSELFEHCARHGWNDMIFEAWAYETAAGIHRIARELEGDAREALLVYARAEGVMDVLFSEAMEAIEEARHYLYEE